MSTIGARLAHGLRDTEHPLLSIQCTLLSKPTGQSTKAGQTFPARHFLTFSSAAEVQSYTRSPGCCSWCISHLGETWTNKHTKHNKHISILKISNIFYYFTLHIKASKISKHVTLHTFLTNGGPKPRPYIYICINIALRTRYNSNYL